MELQEYILLRYKPRKRKAKPEDGSFRLLNSAPRFSLSNSIDTCSFDDNFDDDEFIIEKQKSSKRPLPKVEKTFMEQVFAIIDEKGLDDVETYKKANIDRRLFSKMRSDMKYRPSRDTAFKFCFALELDLARAKKLLSSAGFAISRSNMRDIVFEYCLTEKIYDLMKVNDKLYEVNVEPELA